MTIWANCIVYNEENFIWFSIMSVINYVDKILVYDTGSNDKTVKFIEEIKKNTGDKIIFKEVGRVDKHQFSKMRQIMLDKSFCDWILVLDGDEVWWEKSIKMVVDIINKKGDKLDAVVTPFINSVGDIYHYQSENAGKYKLVGKKGHLTIRAINRKIPGLHIGGLYGVEGYLDGDNISIQQRDLKRIFFLDTPFLHLTHLKRSSKNGHNKYKYELGASFPKEFKLPKVFYENYPSFIPSPFAKISSVDKLIAAGLTPFRKIKRRLI